MTPDLDRRTILAATAGVLAWSLAAGAQSPRTPRLCFLTFDPSTLGSNRFGAFFQGLRDLGYLEGRNLTIDYLSAEGRAERLPTLANECVRLNSDIIVVTTTPFAQAAKSVTSTIPIVLLGLGDPVGTKLVHSLGRPGGNVTGTTSMSPGLSAKRLELLKATVPRISRVLVLAYLVDPIAGPQIDELKTTALALGVKLQIQGIASADDLPAAFNAGAKERAEALLVTSGSMFIVHRARVTELAARHRLPAMFSNRLISEAGGLMVYEADRAGLEVTTAAYVDRLLKGAKPSDLPVQQPTKFELLINLKTAKALGLTIPASVLQRADQVIE
jgi:putative ABC transport system substrate-binding protein